MSYRFDQIVNRQGTGCVKWDGCKEAFGTADVIPLWVADMDFASPPQVTEALIRRAGEGLFGYTKNAPSVGEAVAGWVARRYGWKIDPEWLVYTPGVIPGLNFALQAVTRPGDKVIVQPPVYHPFYSSITSNGCHPSHNLLLRDEGGRYTVDFADLEARFDDRTSMFVLCSPHNPVGRVWTAEELRQMGEICLRKGAVIVSDEIHADIILPGSKHVSLASLSDELAQSTITLISPAKTFNLPGLKASAAIIPNAKLRRDFTRAADRSGIRSINLFGMIAMEAAYTYGDDWLDELIGYLDGNVSYLEAFVGERLKGIRMARPDGTFLAWLDCNGLGVEAGSLKKFMVEKARVGLNDGAMFGPGGAGFQRLNFACHRSTLEEALRRIEEAAETLQ